MGIHFKLHATQFEHLTQTQTHPPHYLNVHPAPPQNMEDAIFHDNDNYTNIILDSDIKPGKYKKISNILI